MTSIWWIFPSMLRVSLQIPSILMKFVCHFPTTNEFKKACWIVACIFIEFTIPNLLISSLPYVPQHHSETIHNPCCAAVDDSKIKFCTWWNGPYIRLNLRPYVTILPNCYSLLAFKQDISITFIFPFTKTTRSLTLNPSCYEFFSRRRSPPRYPPPPP